MNLVSCGRCGVVLDKNRLIFPDVYDHDTGEVILENTLWDGDDYVAKVDCPVCKAPIPEHD